MKLLKIVFYLFVLLSSSLVNAQSDTLKDPRDGKVYKTIKIGSQIWMAENLAYSEIPFSYCYGNNKDFFVANTKCEQGRVYYTWDAAQKACPIGWHLPSIEEFKTLLSYLGGSKEDLYNKLKAGGGSGFEAQFFGKGDALNKDSAFIVSRTFDKMAFFWSSTKFYKESMARCMMMNQNGISKVALGDMYKRYTFSVRCIKD